MDSSAKALLFDLAAARLCEVGEQLFAGTNARFVVVAWIDGHCDGEDAVAIGAPPNAQGEVTTALRFAASWAATNHTAGNP